LAVSPSTCSANVATGQEPSLQTNRRTSNSTWIGRPPHDKSCRRRRYRSCTRELAAARREIERLRATVTEQAVALHLHQGKSLWG
jgi:hypothetical protein